MPPSPVESQIRDRVQQFVDELTGLVRSAAMDAVGTALGNGATAAPARRGRPPGRKKAGRRGSARSVDTGPVLAAIKASPGIGVTEIAAGMGVDSSAVKPAVAELLEAGEIRKTGERRGTRYHPAGRTGGGQAGGGAKKKAGRKKAGRRKKTAGGKTASKSVA